MNPEPHWIRAALVVAVLIWTAQSAPVPPPSPSPASHVTNPATTVPPVVSSPASPGGGVSGP